MVISIDCVRFVVVLVCCVKVVWNRVGMVLNVMFYRIVVSSSVFVMLGYISKVSIGMMKLIIVVYISVCRW